MFYYNKRNTIDGNKVVFVSFNGKSYSDNPKAISEKLHDLRPQTDIVWIFENPEEKNGIVPDYVRMVKMKTLSMLYELATAQVWVDNFDKPLYTYKGKNQYYIQTWHGDRGFKKTRYDSTFIGPKYRLIEKDICDLGIAGSDNAERVYKSAFRYEGEILKVGTPRNDCLVNPDMDRCHEIKVELGIKPETNIVLYAPTLRRQASAEGTLQEIQAINLTDLVSVLEEESHENWVCIVRGHISVAGLTGFETNDKIIDLSHYEDMADILLISDMYISDYSSSAGDFVLKNKPVILYQNDREMYLEKDRTFYFDIDKSPYLVALNQKELIEKVRFLKTINIEENCKEILEFYGANETGHSAEAVSKIIIERLN